MELKESKSEVTIERGNSEEFAKLIVSTTDAILVSASMRLTEVGPNGFLVRSEGHKPDECMSLRHGQPR